MKPDETDRTKPLLDRETWEKWGREDAYGGLDPLLVELSDVLPSSAFENVDLS